MGNVKVRIVYGLALMCVGLAWGQEMCSIQGSDGTCSVSLDAYHTSNKDCSKFNDIKYVGVCRDGKLQGVAVLRVSRVVKGENFTWQQLSNFEMGAVEGLSVTYGVNSIGYEDYATQNAGVCMYGNEVDLRRKKPACMEAASTFSGEVMSKPFWERVTKNLIKPNQLPQLAAGADDSKTVGRGVRGG